MDATVSITAVQAILAGLCYYLGSSLLGYTSMLYNPLVIALPLGIVMGDVPQAMIIGAYLQMVYIGVVSGLGGVATVDKPLATAITIPIAIATGMSPELAMAIALPFGIIGANISHLEKIIFTYFVHKADKFAEEANTGAIVRCSTIYRFVPR